MRIAQFKVTGSFAAASSLANANDSELDKDYEIVGDGITPDACNMSVVKNLDFAAVTPLDEQGFCLDKGSVTPFSAFAIMLSKLRDRIKLFANPETDTLCMQGDIQISYSVYINEVDEENLFSRDGRALTINSLADLDLLIEIVNANFPKYKQMNLFFFGDFAEPCFVSFANAAERCFGGDASSPTNGQKLKV